VLIGSGIKGFATLAQRPVRHRIIALEKSNKALQQANAEQEHELQDLLAQATNIYNVLQQVCKKNEADCPVVVQPTIRVISGGTTTSSTTVTSTTSSTTTSTTRPPPTTTTTECPTIKINNVVCR
jgi:hypothetical protein